MTSVDGVKLPPPREPRERSASATRPGEPTEAKTGEAKTGEAKTGDDRPRSRRVDLLPQVAVALAAPPAVGASSVPIAVHGVQGVGVQGIGEQGAATIGAAAMGTPVTTLATPATPPPAGAATGAALAEAGAASAEQGGQAVGAAPTGAADTVAGTPGGLGLRIAFVGQSQTGSSVATAQGETVSAGWQTAFATATSLGAGAMPTPPLAQATAGHAVRDAGPVVAITPVGPTLANEVSFINALNPDGSLITDPASSYWTYSGVSARKWGAATAGTPGGQVTYWFDTTSAFSTLEQSTIEEAFALWSAVANISFSLASSVGSANVLLQRGAKGSGEYFYDEGHVTPGSGSTLGQYNGQTLINFDTQTAGFELTGSFSTYAGYGLGAIVHEMGHLLGLGHGGPYNGNVDPSTQQYSAYDSRLWSIMSYIIPFNNPYYGTAEYYSSYPVSGTDWGNSSDGTGVVEAPTTMMPLDIMAVQQIYGAAVGGPLAGGNTFGFNCNISGAIEPFFDFTKNTQPVITLYDGGSGNTLDVSGYSQAATIDLLPGTFSSCDGLTNNIGIAFGTEIDNAVCGAGNDTIIANADVNRLTGGGGQDTFEGLAANLNGDMITDFVTGDRIWISDAALSTFSYQYDAGQRTIDYVLGGVSYSVTLDTAFTDGLQLSQDSAGGVDLLGTTAVAPTVTLASLVVGAGGQLTFSGVQSASTSVAVVNGTTLIGNAVVDSAGTWSLVITPPAGIYKFLKVVATGNAGQTATATPLFTVVAGVTGQPYATLVNTIDTSGVTTAQTYVNTDGSTYLGMKVSHPSASSMAQTFSGGSYFTGKPFNTYVNTYNSGNVLISTAYYNVTGQAYTSYQNDFDSSRHIVDQKYFGFKNRPYTSDVIIFTNGVVSGQNEYSGSSLYLADKIATSATGVVSNLYYEGSALVGRPYTSYENDYKAGKLIEQQFLGVSNQSYSSYDYFYDAAGHVASQQTNFTNGTHGLKGLEDGATLTSVRNDTMTGGGANATFLFNTAYAHDTITDFSGRLTGTGHDTLSVAKSKFADFNTLLAHTQTSGANAIITGSGGDIITLAGITKTMLAANQGDVVFHA